MNKKGYAPLVGIIIFVLIILGVMNIFEYKVPAIIRELQDDLCISTEKNLEFCFTNETGIRIKGKFENIKLELDSDGINKICYVKDKNYNLEQVCVNEFGYIHDTNNFQINVYQNEIIIDSISKEVVSMIFANLIKNPKFLGSGIKLTAGESLLVLEGIEYLGRKYREDKNG